MEKLLTLTVSQLNEYMKMLIDGQSVLHKVFVLGEISNFVNHRTGHFYFSLKDETSLIKAVMFRSYASKLKFVPENGMKVIVQGGISVFERDGIYQLYAEDIQPDGVGALYIAYEQLKQKLEAEGLFDNSMKKAIPQIPETIGIVTSPTGAAVRDMINVLGRRFSLANVYIYPAMVQGTEAPMQLISGIRYFNENKTDVIIIGRGGGSIEDLWAFNNEALARAVAASKVPVISAVGHETDFTICDFAADLRAPTPSAAAELAVPDKSELKGYVAYLKSRTDSLIMSLIKSKRNDLMLSQAAVSYKEFEHLIDSRRVDIGNITDRLNVSAKNRITNKQLEFRALSSKLSGLNPLAVLSRGYGAVTDQNGEIVSSVADVEIDQKINIRLHDGTVKAKIIQKESNNNTSNDIP